jgi:hypothetical protein
MNPLTINKYKKKNVKVKIICKKKEDPHQGPQFSV